MESWLYFAEVHPFLFDFFSIWCDTGSLAEQFRGLWTEITTIFVLNGHGFKLPSEWLCTYLYISAALNLNLFAMDDGYWKDS